MRIALVFLDKLEGAPHLGIAYIASYVRKYGGFNDIVIIDKEDPVKAMKKQKPDIVGITSVTKEFKLATALADTIKSDFDVPTILGGVHVTELPHTLPPSFDIGVLGEGEETMLELMKMYEKRGEFKKDLLKDVRGVAFHDNGRILVTEQRPFIEPLDRIPYPARDLLNMDFYLKPGRTVPDKITVGTTMMTSRGCPYNCIFCASPHFWRRTTRFHSPEYVVGEIGMLAEKYKVQSIRIWDDLFTTNIGRLKEIVRLTRAAGLHEKIDFYCYGRANLMTEEVCKLLKQMNVRYLSFGLESGSDKVLGYLKRGTVTAEQNRSAVELCKKFGFVIDATFIFGTPGETREDVQKTFDLMKNDAIDRALAFPLTPYPGTELWELVKRDGAVKDEKDVDWETVDTRRFDEKLYMNKSMGQKEFLEQFDAAQKYIREVKNARLPRMSLKYMLNPMFIKRFLSDWRGFSKEAINAVRNAVRLKIVKNK